MKYRKIIINLLLILLLITSCSKQNDVINTTISDNSQIYDNSLNNNVKEIYVTVLPPKANEDRYNFTFDELNADLTDPISNLDPEVKIIFQEGKNGEISKSDYGFGLTQYNATMEQRGQSARLSPLKSYKINLNTKAPWDGYVTVNLNKHPFDDLRIRNKLAFDLIKDIPDITSARTQFIHLFIKDYSEENYSNDFVDYGLFTQIENIDKKYLENHNLDPNGTLYKIENFEFKRYEDIIMDVDDSDYSKKAFETILEIKEADNHTKLISMLDAVNNDNININKVIDTYFDRENFLTWLALNIITDNVDTQSRNYFLYSPSQYNIWYFIPWDYDKALGGYEDFRPIWQKGVSNFWGNTLINRYLRNEENREELTKKIEEISEIINQKEIDKYVDLYKPISLDFLTRYPDSSINKLSDEEINNEIEKLRKSKDVNIDEYYKSLQRPMPVFLYTPYSTGNFLEFNWSDSFDFQSDQIYYDFQLSDSPHFDNILLEKKNLLDNELIIDNLPAGHYFYRVFIKDKYNNTSDAFDIYYDRATLTYCYGVKDFYSN